ncbi:MAG TPA: hypothetical protein VM942_05830, partial [Acidimicrobiales bacterium]|nr:hypothetical protein [Acidimicrobiales bacterium]
MSLVPMSRRPATWVLGWLFLLTACSSGNGGSGAAPTTNVQDGLVARVASFDLAVGPPSRVIVGVQSTDLRLVVYGTVDFRFSYLGTKDVPVTTPAPGPAVTATYLPVPGTPAPPDGAVPQLATGSQARGVYGATVGFDRAGFWQVEVTARVDDPEAGGGGEDAPRTATGAFEVLERHVIPAPGDEAPRTENLTVDSPADVPRGAIDSRAGSDGASPIPDPELHATTVAAALAAGRPVVVAVSTPVYCTSRFCGPVTDLVQELSYVYGDRASFVHIEVFRNFQDTVINQAAADWIYPDRTGGLNEPWVFVVGGDGRITA